jgi:Histidine phosphatase superfamily (branch 1)
MKFLNIFLLFFVTACATSGDVGFRQHVNFAPPLPNTNPEPLVSGPKAIADTLAKGGYVIYLRHGKTQYDQLERERDNRKNGTFDLAKCETQRQLSDEGRAEMRLAGSQFRQVRLPIDKVWSSRYCRAIDSAAFFVDGAEPTQGLSGEGDFGVDPSIKGRVQAFLAQRPAPGKNHFMMAHGGIFWLATGFAIQEGHTVVLDPTNPKVIVARIGPNEWGAVAQARLASP